MRLHTAATKLDEMSSFPLGRLCALKRQRRGRGRGRERGRARRLLENEHVDGLSVKQSAHTGRKGLTKANHANPFLFARKLLMQKASKIYISSNPKRRTKAASRFEP